MRLPFLLIAAALSVPAAFPASAPAIGAFTAAPAQVASGQSTALYWSVTGATSVSIAPGVGSVTGASVKVTPAATTTYTLTAGNPSGSRTATTTVTVGGPPVIAGFAASPPQISIRQSSALSWSVSGAASLSIAPGVGPVTGTSVNVSPKATTTYTLTATNSFGSRTATATVTAGSPPAIAALVASPAKVVIGQPSTLYWTAVGATRLTITPGVGAVKGTSVKVTPPATTTYTLTGVNAFGTATATVTVTVGNLPAIASFAAAPASIASGQSSTLSWAVTGATSLSISPSVGPGVAMETSAAVSPAVTTTYTLTATNIIGSITASTMVAVGSPPVIASFTAAPASVASGQASTLSWAVTGAASLTLGPSVGRVTGTSFNVTPTAPTTYTLTATNAFGTAEATATVTAGNLPALPVIDSFSANPNVWAGPGISALLTWNTTGATSLSIDHGVGTVAGNTVSVSPSATTAYTLTATNAAGSVTATATVNYLPLIKLTSQLAYSEHVLFIVPNPSQVTWTGSDSWDSVYSPANVNSYVATLKSLFPSDYFFVVVTANNLTPNYVPSVIDYRYMGAGFGRDEVTGVGVPDICRYNIGGGTVIDGSFGVLDHEIGHNWEVFIGSEVGMPHWLSNSTATGQMADVYSDDNYATVKQISGDPVNGFTWTSVDNITQNEFETFSLNDLYLQGLNPTFPDLYVLDTPVYNADHTMSYSSVAKYDQAWVVENNGVRNPSYQTSPKKFRMGVVYIARDMAEVLTVYQPAERSINHFVNDEQIDTTTYRFQVPFLADTQYRASVDALLADLDGNRTPTLNLNGPAYLTSSDGNATVPFTAADPDGPTPTVSCVPGSANCSISGTSAILTGLSSGTHFFIIKAQDAGGKKAFAEFVIDVQ